METLILLDSLTPPASTDRAALRQQQHIRGRELSLLAAARLGQVAPSRLALTQQGTPRLLLDNKPAPWSLSISHSGPWVAAAVSPSPRLGLDIEQLRERDAEEALAYLLDDEERHWLATALPGAPPLLRFYRAWTLKEAVGKRDGRGWDTPRQQLALPRIAGHAGHLPLSRQQLLLAIAADEPLHCQLQLGDDAAQSAPLECWPGLIAP